MKILQELIGQGDKLCGEVSDWVRELEASVTLGNRLTQEEVNRLRDIEDVVSKRITALWRILSDAKNHVLPESKLADEIEKEVFGNADLEEEKESLAYRN